MNPSEDPVTLRSSAMRHRTSKKLSSGELPNRTQLAEFNRRLAAAQELPAVLSDLLKQLPKNAVHVLTNVEFLQGNAVAYSTPLVESREINAPERKAAVFQLDVPLSQLRPGLYMCQVNVIDDAGGSFSFPRLAILVKQPANVTAANVAQP